MTVTELRVWVETQPDLVLFDSQRDLYREDGGFYCVATLCYRKPPSHEVRGFGVTPARARAALARLITRIREAK